MNSDLTEKLRKLRNKRDYLEKHLNEENITKLKHIYKKINTICNVQSGGGLFDFFKSYIKSSDYEKSNDEEESDEGEIKKHVIVEKSQTIKEPESSSDIKKIEEEKEDNVTAVPDEEKIEEKEEEIKLQKEMEEGWKKDMEDIKQDVKIKKEEKLQKEIQKGVKEIMEESPDKKLYTKFLSLSKKEETNDEKEITIKNFEKINPLIKELLENSNDWNSFYKNLKNVFIINTLFFRDDIFKSSNKNSLLVLLQLLNKHLYENNTLPLLEKLKKIHLFYPELFYKKSYKKELLNYFDVTDSILDFMGKVTEEDNKFLEKIGSDLISHLNFYFL